MPLPQKNSQRTLNKRNFFTNHETEDKQKAAVNIVSQAVI